MAHSIFFSVEDGKGDVSIIEIPFPSATAVTDLPHLVRAFAALIDPIVGGRCLNAGFRVDVDVVSQWPGVANLTSDVQEKAEFVFRTATNFLKRLNLPAVIESIFVTGSKEVDRADTNIAAFITAMEDGVNLTGVGGSGTVQPCDSRGDDLDALVTAVENWGKRRG